jgi:hypothetical protein
MFRELYVQSGGDDQLIDAGYWLTNFLTTCPDASAQSQEAVRVGEELRSGARAAESPFLLGVLAAATPKRAA